MLSSPWIQEGGLSAELGMALSAGLLGQSAHPCQSAPGVGRKLKVAPVNPEEHFPTQKRSCFAKHVLQPKAGANHRSPSQSGTKKRVVTPNNREGEFKQI